MKAAMKALAQLALYVPLMALIAYFSSSPRFSAIQENEALLRLSLIHAAEHKQACRQRSAEELAKLAPNMRAAQDCPRERARILVELDVDGVTVLKRELPPSGLRHDGNAALYYRLPLPAGRHLVAARLRDRADGEFNYQKSESVELAPGHILLIDFLGSHGGFVFRR